MSDGAGPFLSDDDLSDIGSGYIRYIQQDINIFGVFAGSRVSAMILSKRNVP
jgi:hypothetical protein